MRQLLYVMQFKGSVSPWGESVKVQRCTSTAKSCSFRTAVTPNGLKASLEPSAGGDARFESEVTITGQGTFLESGAVSFGKGHRLLFETVGRGHVGPSADPKVHQGAVVWRVTGGEGIFHNASGLITSNFTLDEHGGVMDNQLGVVYIELGRAADA